MLPRLKKKKEKPKKTNILPLLLLLFFFFFVFFSVMNLLSGCTAGSFRVVLSHNKPTAFEYFYPFFSLLFACFEGSIFFLLFFFLISWGIFHVRMSPKKGLHEGFFAVSTSEVGKLEVFSLQRTLCRLVILCYRTIFEVWVHPWGKKKKKKMKKKKVKICPTTLYFSVILFALYVLVYS